MVTCQHGESEFHLVDKCEVYVLIERRRQVKVYTVMSQGSADYDPSLGVLRQYHSCTLPEYMGTVSDIKVCGHIVGTTIAKFPNMSYPPSYEVLLIDATTGSALLFDPKLPQVSVFDNNSLI